jgi:hypothetical protein
MKPEVEEIMGKGTDKRLKGNISKVKYLPITCETCIGDMKECKKEKFNDDMSEYEWCVKTNRCGWSPAYRYRPFFCKDCSGYGELGAYHNTNDEDFPSVKCCRHSEPCFNNHLQYPKNKVYYKRLNSWKIIRCDKDGNEM